MENSDLLNGITWHLECMALAASAIDNFHPPADPFQVRMNYSLYLTNLMSAIDMVSEIQDSSFETALESSLTTTLSSGAEVLGYMRELRNGVVHRGIDPTSGGSVVDGVVCAVAPPVVKNRSGNKSYSAPAALLRDIFFHCEIVSKPIVESFLEAKFSEVASITPERAFDDVLNSVETTQHMPDWAKTTAREQIRPEMLVQAKANQIQKLRGLLRPRAGPRIA